VHACTVLVVMMLTGFFGFSAFVPTVVFAGVALAANGMQVVRTNGCPPAALFIFLLGISDEGRTRRGGQSDQYGQAVHASKFPCLN